MNETQSGMVEMGAEEARETAGGSLWTWLFGEPSTTFGGGSSGGGGASGSW